MHKYYIIAPLGSLGTRGRRVAGGSSGDGGRPRSTTSGSLSIDAPSVVFPYLRLHEVTSLWGDGRVPGNGLGRPAESDMGVRKATANHRTYFCQTPL